MTFTVQIEQSPFNPVQSFTAVACGTEKITLRIADESARSNKEAQTNVRR